MRRNRRAKIVATLGPATSSRGQIERLFRAGVDVFRLNFSHGSHAEMKARIDIIREIEWEMDRPIGILVDLQGPKLRVGEFEQGSVKLREGARFTLDLEDTPGTVDRVTLPHPEVFAVLQQGQKLLLDDGRIELSVISVDEKQIVAGVVVGGVLSDHKGVNVPDAILPISALTDKDREDLAMVLGQDIDWIALSFVQRPEDVAEVKAIVKGRATVMVKLEKPAAVRRGVLEEILDEADAVMVARGDLGVELPCEDVPGLQKRIVRAARRRGRPVVVATQMLESMVHSPVPTRAEASDVATAIYEGADAVMLSAETAVGDYPHETVTIMSRIIEKVERDPFYTQVMEADRHQPEETIADAISAAARQAAHTIGAQAIVTFTSTGSTSLRVARERPDVPVLTLTPEMATARRLSLVWGIHALRIGNVTNGAEMVELATELSERDEFAKSLDKIIIVAGFPFGTAGTTNNIRIAVIP